MLLDLDSPNLLLPEARTSQPLLTYLATWLRHSRPQPALTNLRGSHGNGESGTSSLRSTYAPERTLLPTSVFDFPLLILVLHAALSIPYKHPDIFFRILSAAYIADSGLTVDTLPPVLAPAAVSNAPDKYL